MQCNFSLTLDYQVNINDNIKGSGDPEAIHFTQQFLDRLKMEDETSLAFFQATVLERMQDAGFFREYPLEKKLEIPDRDRILLELLPSLPPQAAAYIQRVFSMDDSWDPETADRNLALILDQIGTPVLVGFTLKKKGKNLT